MTASGWRRGVCAALLWLQAALLGAGVPPTLLMLLLSAWEGGDVAWKHRLVVWAPLALVTQPAVAVLLVVAALAVIRRRPHAAMLTWVGAALVAGISAGWACVGVPHTSPSQGSADVITIWAIWSTPGLLAAAFVSRRPVPAEALDQARDGSKAST